MANYESGDNDLEFLDDEDDVKGDIETRMAMALHNQEYARQMSMEERRATALKSLNPCGTEECMNKVLKYECEFKMFFILVLF